jgi:3',5'-cyclic AMP phosphodiesterase CpdA
MMKEPQLSIPQVSEARELLYFWAIGDLHYYAADTWYTFHSQRLSALYRDLRSLWSREGTPAFCVSPGDIVETGALENYQLAKRELSALLGAIPFYPGIGNHELWIPGEDEEKESLIRDFTTFWGKPAHYYWTEDSVLCIMLDAIGYPEPHFREETLAFLKTALAKHPQHIAVIFSHCPLYNTVQDRDIQTRRDYHSLDPFFFIQNTDEVYAILERHKTGSLYISGHTHSGWQAPNLVYIRQIGSHHLTCVNLMSPWYTGLGKGASARDDSTAFSYQADEPDLVISFAFHIYRDHARISLRDHREQRWLTQWEVPLT